MPFDERPRMMHASNKTFHSPRFDAIQTIETDQKMNELVHVRTRFVPAPGVIESRYVRARKVPSGEVKSRVGCNCTNC